MAKRSIIIFIVSLLILLAISLWLYTARIISSVVPPIVNNETLQIDSLEISSVGWRQAVIARVSGSAGVETGWIHFDIRNALANYDLNRLQPGRIEISQADIAYEAFDQGVLAMATPTEALVVPPEIIVNQLHFQVKDNAVEFNGKFELTGSKEGFSALARDDKMQLELAADAKLSSFQTTIMQIDGIEIADFKLNLENSDLADFAGVVRLAPLLTLLKDTPPLPKEYRDLLRDIKSAAGSIHVSGHQTTDDRWQAHIDIDASNVVTTHFYGSAVLQGDLTAGIEGWQFTSTHPGFSQIHIPSYRLDDISTIGLGLPVGYVISQDLLDQKTITLIGNGEADFSFHRTGDTELEAKLVNWQLDNWEDLVAEMKNLTVVSPYAVNADSVKSKIQLTNISPLLIRGDIDVSAARTDAWPIDIPNFDLQGDWNWSEGALDINGVAYWNGSATANWSLMSKDDIGALQIDLDQPVVELVRPMQQFFKNRKQDVSFSDGSIRGQLNWSWDKEFYDNRLALTATGVDGRVLGLRLKNGSIEVNSSDLVALVLQLQSSIPVVTLANDVDVTDLNIGGRWQNGLYVDHADLSIFGGIVKMNPVFLSFDGKPNTVELEVKDIDLEQVLLMFDQAGLGGSGQLSGTIPLGITESGVAINDGYLKNSTKGTLSYSLSGEPAPQLDNIALQALQDFRYDALDVKLNYQTNGDYTIRARLEGRNPQLYDGYPIAFNINLNGSLPGLLRASLITGDFHGEILKRIQQEQE